jgi:hypothetical protein
MAEFPEGELGHAVCGDTVDVFKDETRKGRPVYRGVVEHALPRQMDGTWFALVKGETSVIWTDVRRLRKC